MTRLSCRRFRSNEVRLWLSVIAYNLGNLWRQLVLCQLAAAAGEDGRVLVNHAGYYWLFLGESHLTRWLFGAMVGRMEALTLPAGWGNAR
jgi:hypothetical protein